MTKQGPTKSTPASADRRLHDDDAFGEWYAANAARLDEIDEDMTMLAVVRHYLASFPCQHCGAQVVETETRRDTRHDHCGPLPHTGEPGDPGCDRCGGAE